LRAILAHTIKWRDGTNDGCPCADAVHFASSHEQPGKAHKEWQLIEWPEGEEAPTKYWLSTLPYNIPFDDPVAAKLHWRIAHAIDRWPAGRFPGGHRRCSMNSHNGGIEQHVFVSVADNVEALQFAEAARQVAPRRADPEPYTMASTNSRLPDAVLPTWCSPPRRISLARSH
jgi:hypothetical protein